MSHVVVDQEVVQALALAVAAELKDTLQKSIPFEQRLLDSDDIGRYMGISGRHVRDRLSKRKGFPAPVTIPSSVDSPGCARRLLRWRASDIIKWVEGTNR